MQFTNISEKELEKINLIFNLMNRLSDSSLDEYINSKMKRYEFISRIVKYSIETIRKILARAKTYKYIKIKNYSFKIYYYDVQIYLNYLNNKRNKHKKTKEEKSISKYYKIGKLIKQIVKATRNKTSAKTLSKIIKIKLGIYISAKHLYYLVRNNKIYGVSTRVFPQLKYGKYCKKPVKIGKKIIATPINQRDEIINKRIRYGDVEIDTVEGSKSDNKYLATMIDRKSRRLSITLYENKQSLEFLKALKTNMKKMNCKIKSITSDNGTENVRISELKIPWYATNPYSSWQKGTM